MNYSGPRSVDSAGGVDYRKRVHVIARPPWSSGRKGSIDMALQKYSHITACGISDTDGVPITSPRHPAMACHLLCLRGLRGLSRPECRLRPGGRHRPLRRAHCAWRLLYCEEEFEPRHKIYGDWAVVSEVSCFDRRSIRTPGFFLPGQPGVKRCLDLILRGEFGTV